MFDGVKLSKKFLSRRDTFFVSPSWFGCGHWAVRREMLLSPDLSGLGAGGVELTTGEIATKLGLEPYRAQWHWREDDMFEAMLCPEPDGAERFRRQEWVKVGCDSGRNVDSVLFQGDDSGTPCFIDRDFVQTFDVDELVMGAGGKVAMHDPERRVVIARRVGDLPRVMVTKDRVIREEDLMAAVRDACAEAKLDPGVGGQLSYAIGRRIGVAV